MRLFFAGFNLHFEVEPVYILIEELVQNPTIPKETQKSDF
jgi:hypothetical protein